MNTNIEKFKKRNRHRNARLYQLGSIQGHDYVVCPVSNERMSMIKSTYIEKVLGMSVDEYERLYPNLEKICSARKENIKTGLKQIDPITGLTKYEVGQRKAKQVLSKVDENGISGYKKKGQKTRTTHMRKIDQFGRNGYRRQADYRLTTILPNGLTIEQNAHKKQKESLIKNNKTGSGGASKLSKKVLQPILKFLNEEKVNFYFDKTEYGIKDPDTGNYYFWDLTIPDLKIAIEYQSNAWHANPILSEQDWENWKTPRGKKKTAEETLKYDYDKARSLYKNRDYLTYYIWQKSERENIEEILCLLKTLITKS
jgi:hypothetical protein